MTYNRDQRSLLQHSAVDWVAGDDKNLTFFAGGVTDLFTATHTWLPCGMCRIGPQFQVTVPDWQPPMRRRRTRGVKLRGMHRDSVLLVPRVRQRHYVDRLSVLVCVEWACQWRTHYRPTGSVFTSGPHICIQLTRAQTDDADAPLALAVNTSATVECSFVLIVLSLLDRYSRIERGGFHGRFRSR